jgi:hypothetical protein
MLIDSIKKTYREMTSHVESVQPVVTVPVIRLAANAGSFENSEMQARRHRRQRRLERMGQHSINGWKVRAW